MAGLDTRAVGGRRRLCGNKMHATYEGGGKRQHLAPAHVWISRPPANDQFSQDVSLKQTITFSVSMPARASVLISSSSNFFLTLTLRPTDHRISTRANSTL